MCMCKQTTRLMTIRRAARRRRRRANRRECSRARMGSMRLKRIHRLKSKAANRLVSLSLAGSYAQLTLLGQARINSVSTQRIPPADNPTSRIPPLRTGTQTSAPERSNSTTSTHSLQASSDTRKVRNNYERILKQLEVNAGRLFGMSLALCR